MGGGGIIGGRGYHWGEGVSLGGGGIIGGRGYHWGEGVSLGGGGIIGGRGYHWGEGVSLGEGASLEGVPLEGVSLEGEGASLEGVPLEGVSLEGEGASLEGVSLEGGGGVSLEGGGGHHCREGVSLEGVSLIGGRGWSQSQIPKRPSLLKHPLVLFQYTLITDVFTIIVSADLNNTNTTVSLGGEGWEGVKEGVGRSNVHAYRNFVP